MLRLQLLFLELLKLCVDLLVPLRLGGHVLERVEALVEAAIRCARCVYGLFAVKTIQMLKNIHYHRKTQENSRFFVVIEVIVLLFFHSASDQWIESLDDTDASRQLRRRFVPH